MITFDSNCLYIIQCLALVFVAAPCVLFAGAVLAALLAAAYTAGLCAGKAAAHLDEDDEPKIYMDHTHGGED